jgi:hypothetical protein
VWAVQVAETSSSVFDDGGREGVAGREGVHDRMSMLHIDTLSWLIVFQGVKVEGDSCSLWS